MSYSWLLYNIKRIFWKGQQRILSLGFVGMSHCISKCNYFAPIVNSPNEFLPAEFAGMRGIEQRMYKEQEKIKSKSHIEIQKFYIKYASSLATNDTVFFPVRVCCLSH